MADPLPELPKGLAAAQAVIVRSLEPALQVLALEHHANLAALGIRLQFNSGRRSHADTLRIAADTATATARELAAQGLTGIAATGTSLHELGLAYDGEPSPKNDQTWAIYGREAKALGLVWGGDWTRKLPSGEVVSDRPHVQMPGKVELWRQAIAAGVLVALAVAIAVLVKRARAYA